MRRSGSWIASTMSFDVTSTCLGSPVTRSRPHTSVTSGCFIETAEPTAIFASSAVRSPISRLCLRLK